MMSSATCLWKHSGEVEHHSGLAEKCSASTRNGVHFHPGIVFRISPECCSASSRNGVQLRPDSPRWTRRLPKSVRRPPVLVSAMSDLASWIRPIVPSYRARSAAVGLVLCGALDGSLPSEEEEMATTKRAPTGLKDSLADSLDSVSSAYTSKLDGFAVWTAFREQAYGRAHHNPNRHLSPCCLGRAQREFR